MRGAQLSHTWLVLLVKPAQETDLRYQVFTCQRHLCALCADNVAEEVYEVEHLDALGSRKQEW